MTLPNRAPSPLAVACLLLPLALAASSPASAQGAAGRDPDKDANRTRSAIERTVRLPNLPGIRQHLDQVLPGRGRAQSSGSGSASGGSASDSSPRGARSGSSSSSTTRSRASGPAAPPRGAAGPAAPPRGGGADTEKVEPDQPFRPMPPRARVTFNLENASLMELVRLIANLTGRRFIVPGKIREIQATVYAPTQVTVSQAYRAFLSILQINGLTLVPAGRYLKIVETQNVQNRPLPIYNSDEAMPADDRFLTRIHRLEHIGAEDAAQLLQRFKSTDGQLVAYAPTNMLIITDTGRNVRRMLRLLRAIDVPRGGAQMWIEPVHHANASELAERLKEIFKATAGGGSGGSSRASGSSRPRATAKPKGGRSGGGTATIGSSAGGLTRIIPEERTNALIIIATERAYLRILELLRQLDVPMEGGARVHVYEVQHLDASDLASTLESLVRAGGSRRGGRGGSNSGGQGAVASLFEGEVQVTAHVSSNSLLIVASAHDYAALRQVIEQIDSPRRQVFIEAVVMELSVSRSSALGLSFHGGLVGTPTDGSLVVLGSDAATTLGFPLTLDQDALSGLALGVRGDTIPESQQLIGLSVPAFGVVLTALARSGDANVLSTPHIIAMDNTEAEISVGQNIPLQTSGFPAGLAGLGLAGLGGTAGLAGLASGRRGASAAAGLGALGGLASGFAGGIARQDVGTTIRITPHINDNDEIRLEIEEEISERGATEGDLGVVSINRRTARTELMLRDQQTVVIGGLMRESTTTSETKVPVLGDIPLLGALFRRTTRQKQKSNLLLILTPYIIRDASDLRAIFERKMRERQEFLDRYFVFSGEDYQPPIDYSRTRGLVAEINGTLDDLQAEARLAEEARLRPPPTHEPREPVGSADDLVPSGGDEGNGAASPGATSTPTTSSPTISVTPTATPAPTANQQ